jgi:putative MATE family efflux protein
MGLIFGLALIFIGKEFIGFLHIENVVVERDAYYYLALNGVILFFSFFNILYARILGSFGNNKLAFKINALGLILNVILDPIFIYIFKFGVLGAAIATLIASVVMFIMYLVKSSDILKFNFNVGINKNKIIKIIGLGFPMAFQRILFTIINIMLAKIIASFGSDAIAGQKIGLEIESVMYMIVGGLNGAVSSFTGQNFGAKKFNRIKEGYSEALKLGIIYSLILAVVFFFFNKPLIRLFIREENTVMIAAAYLQVVAFSQIFSTLEMVSNGLFTGIGKPKIPAAISIVFTALRIPMSLILIKPFGVNGIWISIALSSILKGIFAYLICTSEVQKISNSLIC